MNLIISLEENNGINSKLSKHFGLCKYFGIYDIENKNLKIINNQNDHTDKNVSVATEILKYKPDIIFSLGIGPKAITFFTERKVILKTGNYNTLNEVIKNINNLEKITESCKK